VRSGLLIFLHKMEREDRDMEYRLVMCKTQVMLKVKITIPRIELVGDINSLRLT
jgi:hypothetical protein